MELCSVHAIKYLTKYVYKGPDRVMNELSCGNNDDPTEPKVIDEIKVRKINK